MSLELSRRHFLTSATSSVASSALDLSSLSGLMPSQVTLADFTKSLSVIAKVHDALGALSQSLFSNLCCPDSEQGLNQLLVQTVKAVLEFSSNFYGAHPQAIVAKVLAVANKGGAETGGNQYLDSGFLREFAAVHLSNLRRAPLDIQRRYGEIVVEDSPLSPNMPERNRLKGLITRHGTQDGVRSYLVKLRRDLAVYAKESWKIREKAGELADLLEGSGLKNRSVAQRWMRMISDGEIGKVIEDPIFCAISRISAPAKFSVGGKELEMDRKILRDSGFSESDINQIGIPQELVSITSPIYEALEIFDQFLDSNKPRISLPTWLFNVVDRAYSNIRAAVSYEALKSSFGTSFSNALIRCEEILIFGFKDGVESAQSSSGLLSITEISGKVKLGVRIARSNNISGIKILSSGELAIFVKPESNPDGEICSVIKELFSSESLSLIEFPLSSDYYRGVILSGVSLNSLLKKFRALASSC